MDFNFDILKPPSFDLDETKKEFEGLILEECNNHNLAILARYHYAMRLWYHRADVDAEVFHRGRSVMVQKELARRGVEYDVLTGQITAIEDEDNEDAA